MLRTLDGHRGAGDLHGRVELLVGREAGRVRAEALDETAGARGEAVVVEVAHEVRRADADIDRQAAVEELTAIFGADLLEKRDRTAVALLQDIAIARDDRIVDRESLERLAVDLEQPGLAGLAMQAAIVGGDDAHRLSLGDVVAKRGVDAPAVGAGLARREHPDRIEQVAVAVQVTAEIGRAAEIADLAATPRRGRALDALVRSGRVERASDDRTLRVDVAQAFLADDRTAAVRLHPLEAGIHRQDEALGQGEARLHAHVAGVGGVQALFERAAAGVGEVGDARTGDRVDLAAGDRVVALGLGQREAVAGVGPDDAADAGGGGGVAADDRVGIGAQRDRTEEVVAVLVVVDAQHDEVAAMRERLVEHRIILLLVDLAAVAVDIVVGRHAGRAPGAGAERTERAGVDDAEGAEIIATVEPAVGSLDAGGEGLVGAPRLVVHRAAGGRRGRAVDVGRAEADVDPLDQFGIEHLVREDRVVAGVVERHAVERLGDAAAVEAADDEGAAGRAERIVVGEADARQLVDHFVDRLAGNLALDEVGVQDLAGLGGRRDLDTAHRLGARAGDDDGFFFHVGRTGRLRKSGSRHDKRARRAQQSQFSHVPSTPCVGVAGRRAPAVLQKYFVPKGRPRLRGPAFR